MAKIDPKVEAWRKEGRYLPKFLRDFHDQKDLFKTLHDTVNVEAHEYAGQVTWVAGHCYVIDLFLWFMAQHGYTLQRSPRKLPFTDIFETIEASTQQRRKLLGAIFQPKQPT